MTVQKDSRVVLVTGGCGYLGSQLIRDLAGRQDLENVTVRILDNMQRGYYQALMGLPGDGAYQFVAGDLLDPAIMRLVLENVDAVVHLAAIVRTPMSFDRPTWVEQVNHWGTAHLLEYCLEAGVSRFIYASTTAVYGPGGPFAETDPCRPQGAYAQSKRQAEQSILATQERGLPTTVLRFGLIYGLAPVTRFDAVANRFAYLAGVHAPLTVYGSGEQRRSLIHVRDASNAVCFALAHPELAEGRILNVVDKNTSVLELVDAIRLIRPDIPVRFTEQDIRTHLSFEAGNAALLGLGWRPQVTVEAGLAELVQQFRNFELMKLQPFDLE